MKEDRRHDHEKNDIARLEVVGAQPAHFPFGPRGSTVSGKALGPEEVEADESRGASA